MSKDQEARPGRKEVKANGDLLGLLVNAEFRYCNRSDVLFGQDLHIVLWSYRDSPVFRDPKEIVAIKAQLVTWGLSELLVKLEILAHP